MQFNKYQLHYREGVILELTDSDGISQFIEFSPLPGFSQETLCDVKKQLITLLSESIDNLNAHKNHAPCIQFALDYLSIDERPTHFIHQQQNTFITIDNIPLLQGNCEQVIGHYNSLKLPNVIKLKVARGLVSDDIDIFQSLCNLNPNIKIRCDANQAWDEQQAAFFLRHIDIKHLDYIEEPTTNHKLNLQLAKQFNILIGLDETLQQRDFTYQHSPFIRAFIIKPTIIGSKQKIDQLVSFATKQNIIVSFSSSFESIVGLQQLKKLATHYTNNETKGRRPRITLGIDTLKYFNSSRLIDAEKIAQDCQTLEVLWISNR